MNSCRGKNNKQTKRTRTLSPSWFLPDGILCSVFFPFSLAKHAFILYNKSTVILKPRPKEDERMKYVCNLCGWVYDEEEAGVKWEDLPEDFACELCGAGKEDFTPEEE